MLADKFFENTFDLKKEKQEVIDFIQMKKNQDSAEAVFYDNALRSGREWNNSCQRNSWFGHE